jgi:alpha-tubulin suppressor-like RCC1 family protein
MCVVVVSGYRKAVLWAVLLALLSGGHVPAVAQGVWLWGDNQASGLVPGLTGVVAIAAGVYLKSDGTVWAGKVTPAPVPGLTGVVAVAAGASHSLAVKSDGTVWAWGTNGYGELGNGTVTPSATPVRVTGLTGVVAVACGDYHSLAVKSDGTVWAWGYNGVGELGNGTFTGSATPVQVTGLTGVVAVGGGSWHSLALKSDGTVWAWGWNYDGELGNGAFAPNSIATPAQVPGLTGVTAIAAGSWHSLALKSDGTVWAWGLNNTGQLGNGAFAPNSIATPAQVPGLTGVTAIAAGGSVYYNSITRESGPGGHSLALKKDGTVWAWGCNNTGELGVPGIFDLPPYGLATPVQATGLGKAVAVACGYNISLALGRHVVSDFDRDGKPDLLWHNQQNGQLVYWLMDGVKVKPNGMGNLTPSVVSPVWQVVGTPDLDGDGKPDLLWHNQQNGQLVYWLMDGVKIRSSGNLTPSVVSPVWKVVGTPDLDGDGSPDLLWHNQQNGQLVYWLMDGVKIRSSGNLTPSVVSPVWQIAPGS